MPKFGGPLPISLHSCIEYPDMKRWFDTIVDVPTAVLVRNPPQLAARVITP